MAQAAYWLILLNLLDAAATYRGLATGIISEANPLLAWLLQWWPAGAWLLKLAVIPLLLLWVGAQTRPTWAERALELLVVAYGLVMTLHLTGLLRTLA